MANLEDYC